MALCLALPLAFKRNAKRLMALGQLLAVYGSQLVLQLGRGEETVGDCVRVGKGVDINWLYERDANVADAWDVAPLARSHVAEFPQANRLGFFPRADRGQVFVFKEEHNDGRLVAEAARQ